MHSRLADGVGMDIQQSFFFKVSDSLLSLYKRKHTCKYTDVTQRKQHSHALLHIKVNDISCRREKQTGRRRVPPALDRCLVSKCTVQSVFMCVGRVLRLVTHRCYCNGRITEEIVHNSVVIGADILLRPIIQCNYTVVILHMFLACSSVY